MSKSDTGGCEPDSSGVVNLKQILLTHNAPILEEQAWALCYSVAQCYIKSHTNGTKKCASVTKYEHVVLHKDGYLKDSTFWPDSVQDEERLQAPSEGKLVCDVGVVVYRALEYTIGEEEERVLSSSLDHLIDRMTSSDQEVEKGETDDEGIERDSGDLGDERRLAGDIPWTMEDVAKECEDRLLREGVETGAEEHYKAVVRAMVAEAHELSFFLRQIKEGTHLLKQKHKDLLSSEQDLNGLQMEDWTNFWKQIMNELRNGVKLKKVQYTRRSLEYALTPYEMLMEDIRSRRYVLNKVMVNGDIPPRLKQDAHTIILDFIRSRPPLKKASDRKLNPLTPTPSPMELLMESIRKKDQPLKHVPSPTKARQRPVSMFVSSHDETCSEPKRKLICAPKMNFSAEDDDDDLIDVSPSSPRQSHESIYNSSLANSSHVFSSLLSHSPVISTEPGNSSPQENSHISRVAYDLAKYSNSSSVQKERRHSITICENPGGVIEPNSELASKSTKEDSFVYSHDKQDLLSSSPTQKDFLSSPHFSSRLDCLSLTLEEVVHIRNVLTKADLESLPLDVTTKEDVVKGKTCFLCLKTRFTFFGARGRECRLCRRMVCKNCATKMRIPTEHFSNVPVAMLTPQSISPKEDEIQHSSLPRTFFSFLQDSLGTNNERRDSISGCVGSAPSSPASQRSNLGISLFQTSNDVVEDRSQINSPEISEKLKGSLMIVCHDCKAMVIHIILSIRGRRGLPDLNSSSLNRRQPFPVISNSLPTKSTKSMLHLNVTPLYK